MFYKVRPVEERDVSTVYNFICILENTILDYTVFELIFKTNIYDKNFYYLVAESDNSVIGFISCHMQNLLHHCGKVAEIQELFVDEKYRNLGIAALLVDNVEKMLQVHKCHLLEVTANNTRGATHMFYEHLGFECTHKKFVKSLPGKA